MKKLNINNEVTIKLNEYGKELWKNYAYTALDMKNKDIAMKIAKETLDKIQEDDTLTTSLVEIMQVFGNSLFLSPFDFNILINEKMEKLNINDEVTIKLNESGKKLWKNYAYTALDMKNKDMAIEIAKETLDKIQEDDTLTTNLVDIMGVFGKSLHKSPFSFNILINEKDLSDTLSQEKRR